MKMILLFYCFIMTCFAGSYNKPEELTIPNDFSIVTKETQLTNEVITKTECLNVDHNNIYTTAFTLTSTEHIGLIISTNSSISMFVEDSEDSSCLTITSNYAFKIGTNIPYKFVAFSQEYSNEKLTFSFQYIETVQQVQNITSYPFIKTVFGM